MNLICSFCNKEFQSPKKRKTCSNTCAKLLRTQSFKKWRQTHWTPEMEKERIEKIMKTKKERYGNSNYNNMGKNKQTKLERYGNSNYNNMDKNKQTKLKNWGDGKYNNRELFKETYSKKSRKEIDKMLQKQKFTCFQRYGDEFFRNIEKVKEKLRSKSKKEWNEITQKRKQTSKERYNVSNPAQNHFKNKENFNLNFILENFVKSQKFLRDEFCDYFGCDITAVSNFKRKNNLEIPNKNSRSKVQRKLFDSINVKNKKENFRKLISPLEIDIFLPDEKLAIEYNGLLYHSRGYSISSKINSPNFPKNYHLMKTDLCEEQGVQLFHIFEGESLDIWLSMINSKIGLNEKLYARKCEVKEIKFKEASEFLEENHLQGACNSKINLGLFKDNELVSVMTFGKSRFNKQYDWELLRFCSKKNLNVVGGASKLLTYFRSKNAGSIISYANRRWSNGSLYEKLGFTKKGKTSPNYWYFKENSGELLSRVKFQKHKLKNILENFDENLSETQNMLNHGYRQIFDCGNLVYVLD